MPRRGGAEMDAVLSTGRSVGVRVTERDRDRIRACARWYCLSAAHIVRTEHPPSVWRNLNDDDSVNRYTSLLKMTRNRMARLTRVVENGTRTGPLLGAREVHGNYVAYYSTKYGATIAHIPWQLPPDINAQLGRHAWAAADVGIELERDGYVVLSERELATGTTVHDEPYPHDITALYHRSTGSSVTKRPDLALPASDGHSWIAIEIERDRNRPLRTYQEKLTAYDQNPHVLAVWYFCESDTTARRVKSAGHRVFDPHGTGRPRQYPLRVRVLDQMDGWWHVPDMASDEKLTYDLGRLR